MMMMMMMMMMIITLVKAPLATTRTPLRIEAVHLFVCLSVAKMRTQVRNFLKKTKQFTAMFSIDY